MGIFENLIKGMPDWHLLLNKNFDAAQAKFDGLDTQMSNKADKTETVSDLGNTLNEYNTVLEMVNSVKSSAITFAVIGSNLFGAEDCPEVKEWFYVVLNDKRGRKLVVAISYSNYDVWIRRVTSGMWTTDWLQVNSHIQRADMEWKDLPLSSNWTVWNPGWEVKYRKTCDGFVVINGTVKPSESNQDPPSLQQIGTLPTNFSPKRAWYSVCGTSCGTGYARIRVDPSGAVFLDGYSNKASLLSNLELMLMIDTK